MEQNNITKKSISRRDFLISLGVGTSLAIAGFFTFNAITTLANDQPDNPSVKPKLSDYVKKTFENDQMVLHGEKAKCSVNKTGERIIGLLDGKNTLSHISTQISKHYAIDHTGALEAAIASFLCQLGALGFLSSPYYVTIYETC